MPPQSPLTSTTQSALTGKLRDSVNQMIQAGVPRDEIDSAVQRFKQKYLNISQEDYEGPSVLRTAVDTARSLPGALLNTAVGAVRAPFQMAGQIAQEQQQGGIAERAVPGYAAAKTIAGQLIARPAQDQLERARTAASEGRTLESVAHSAAAALPVIGPMAAGVGENIGSGEPERIAQGVTDVASLAAPVPIRGMLRARSRRAPDPTAVPVTASERSGGALPRFAERLTERTIPGAGVFERFRNRQQQALQGLADDLVSRVSRERPTPEQAGLTMQRALDDAMERMKSEAGAIYGQIDEATAGMQPRVVPREGGALHVAGPGGLPVAAGLEGGVATAGLKDVAAPLLRRLDDESALIAPQELSRSRQILERIVNAPEQVSFRVMQDARSDMLRLARSFDDNLPGKAGGIARQVSEVTDDAMMRAAEQSGVPGLPGQIREANRLWRSMNETFKDTVVKKLVDAAPERLPDYVKAASLDDIRRLSDLVPESAMNDVRASIVRDMLNRSTSGELQRSGSLLTGVSPASPPVLSGTQLRGRLEGLGQPKLEALFGSRTATELSDIASLAERVGTRKSPGMAGLIAGGINAAVLSPVLAPLGLGSLGLAQSAGLTAGFNAVARLLVRQPVARTRYLEMLRALERGDVNRAMQSGLAVSAMLNQEDQRPDETGTQPPQ